MTHDSNLPVQQGSPRHLGRLLQAEQGKNGWRHVAERAAGAAAAGPACRR